MYINGEHALTVYSEFDRFACLQRYQDIHIIQ